MSTTGYNGATSIRGTLRQDIAAASAAGFDYLEVWGQKLAGYLAAGTAKDLGREIREAGLLPLAVNSVENVTFTPEGWPDPLLECERLSAVARDAGCPYLIVVPGPRPEGDAGSWQAVLRHSVDRLNALADVASCFGVKLAFEFIGSGSRSVSTVEQAWEIVSRVGRDDVGMVIDSFHFYAGASTLESVAAVDGRRLFVFHINDAEPLPRNLLEDRHRVFPGDGVIPLVELCKAVRSCGYAGPASVEIFRPEYWEWDPARVARVARAKTLRVLEEAGW